MSLSRSSVGALLGIALLLGGIAGDARAADGAQRLNLRALRVTAEGASAPTVGGGRTELTLEPELQRRADRLLAGAAPVAGAIVAVDLATGGVLVWAERTAPGQARGSVLLEARAPAASVMKVVTAAALFEHTSVSPAKRVCTIGGLRRVDREHLRPPRTGAALCAPFSQALGHSRNAAFAQLVAAHLDREELLETAEALGFNQRLPFDVPVTTGTLSLPHDDLDFARAATGFRDSTLTPLGGAYLASVVAKGGRSVPLHIVQAPHDAEAPPSTRVLSARTAHRLARMMEVTVHSGTALKAFSDPSGMSYLRGIRVAGKTGTLKPTADAPTTSWFIGFAPSRRPAIAVSVLLLNGEVWRRKANEVARDLLRIYFRSRGETAISDPADD
ncbi:MAG TPA: penicillin-binding transpeptidase domain-containing protein [Polyangiaceae bacterium]|nr:penicillin-binding transpeptidase domain-containing protein [Polyangiaceae bacterium]